MPEIYNPQKIEKKWQKRWEKEDFSQAVDFSEKPKYYLLFEFPYPSGEGLHVGHTRPYTALDVMARKLRMEGYNVLFPIGWDAFGLPTENYAIKHKIHPSVATKKNVDNFRRQMKMLGLSLDWSREINTTDPTYYKWTQWIFLKLYEKGLAYKKKLWINWCPKDKIGLANEEVVDGKCERCGTLVEKREKEQWILAITKYADRLIQDLDTVDYLEKIKTQQINWIGRSEGAEIIFPIVGTEDDLRVFTTRLDTIYGCTYLVVAPEHEVVEKHKQQITNYTEVEKYLEASKKKSDLQRTDLAKEKTGVLLDGIEAVNPFTSERLPIFIADYILGSYGTGAVMAVPAHDERDLEFAKKYDLEVRKVIDPYFELTGIHAPQAGKETTSKNCVTGIVFDRAGKKVLIQKRRNGGLRMFPGGGIEDQENPKEAMIREVLEETGYHIKIEKELISSLYSRGFKPHKDVNCFDHDVVFLATIENESPEEISEEEKNIHEVSWVEREKVSGLESFAPHHAFMWAEYLAGDQSYTGDGILINSNGYDGLTSAEARAKMTEWLEKEGFGERKVNYKLRDWIFSRQHYWGEPIPIIHCEKDGIVPVSEKDLPVELPEVEHYEPTDTGESPLATMTDWVNVKCPKCRGKAKRETDTMPNWAGSSWYFLRYIDPHNDRVLADPKKLKYWMPVDLYNGGMEHTTLHLLYSRFWNKFLYDIGVVPVSEPYAKRRSHGLVLAEGGQKMSKSKDNVVNPDDIVEEFGADSVRLYELFMGPFSEAIAWNTASVSGVRRFLEKVWRLVEKVSDNTMSKEAEAILHKTIKKVGEDIDDMKFNTTVSALMILVNVWEKEEGIGKEDYEMFLKILSPEAPHITEELWEKLGHKQSIFLETWPKWDPKKIKEEMKEIVIQVNGKVRERMLLPSDISQEECEKKALASQNVQKFLNGKKPEKIIFVPGRLLNIVV